MQLSQEQRVIAWARVAGLCREVGTLLLAFAPLDYALQPDVDPIVLVGFVVVGGGLFVGSLIYDVRGAA